MRIAEFGLRIQSAIRNPQSVLPQSAIENFSNRLSPPSWPGFRFAFGGAQACEL
jgi:hypothetical protein